MVLLHMCLTINHQKQQFTFLHLRYFDFSAIQPPSLIPPWTFIILVKASLFTIIDTALWKEYKQEHFKNTLSVYERKRSFQRGHDILCSSMYIICQAIPRRRSRVLKREPNYAINVQQTTNGNRINWLKNLSDSGDIEKTFWKL